MNYTVGGRLLITFQTKHWTHDDMHDFFDYWCSLAGLEFPKKFTCRWHWSIHFFVAVLCSNVTSSSLGNLVLTISEIHFSACVSDLAYFIHHLAQSHPLFSPRPVQDHFSTGNLLVIYASAMNHGADSESSLIQFLAAFCFLWFPIAFGLLSR